jgi:hypothetical protein
LVGSKGQGSACFQNFSENNGLQGTYISENRLEFVGSKGRGLVFHANDDENSGSLLLKKLGACPQVAIVVVLRVGVLGPDGLWFGVA